MDTYEKKYNEALERAKEFHHPQSTTVRGIVEKIFPELRESEDEKNWKAVLEYIKDDSLRSWLEKQKESLHIPETCKENDKSFADESEDERIRKELLGFVNSFWADHKEKLPQISKWLMWLEKQKEIDSTPLDWNDYKDKPVEVWNAYIRGKAVGIEIEKQKERGPLTKEEEYILHRIIEHLEDETCPSEWISLLHDVYCLPYPKQKEQKPCEDSGTDSDIMQYIEEGKKRGIKEVISFPEKYGLQKEQRPIDDGAREKIISRAKSEKQVVLISESSGNTEIGWDTHSLEDAKKLLEYGLAFINKNGIKPAEWSEDDEQYLLICKNALSKYQRSDQWDANIISNWLERRLKSSPRPKPKQEWSGEDELHRNSIISTIDMCMKDCERAGTVLGCYESDIDWLKSLRSRSYWKPSEEQIEALMNGLRILPPGENNNILLSLYNDLKNL